MSHVAERPRGAAMHSLRVRRLLPFGATWLAFALLLYPLFQVWWALALIPSLVNPAVLNTKRIDQVAHSPHFTIFAPVGYATDAELQNWLDTAEKRRAAIRNYLGLADEDTPIDVYVDPTRMIYEGASFHTILVGDIKNGAGCVAHEMLHVFEHALTSFFSEGLAEHIEGKFGWGECGFTGNHDRDSDLYARLRQGERLPPLSILMGVRLLSPNDPASYLRYEEAGSFVDFLVARYGIARFMQFFHARAYDASSASTAMRETFGDGFDELEQAWLANLRAGNFWQTVAFLCGTAALLGVGVLMVRRGRAYLPSVLMGVLAFGLWSVYWFYPAEFFFILGAGLGLGLLLGVRFKRLGSLVIVSAWVISSFFWIVLPLFHVGI
jgi:hypothetical protein